MTTAVTASDRAVVDDAATDAYLLGRSAAETRRLMFQGDFQAPYTRRFLEDAGLAPGMRVLDAGSGAGDVAFLAADLVGPQGAVIGIDLNPRVLDTARERARAAGLTQVRFVAGDLAADAPDGPFDAVVGRLVLLYQPNPAAALWMLARRVRPGGIVAFQEYSFHAAALAQFPPTPLWGRVYGWLRAGFLAAGVDEYIGYRLAALYRDAGLPMPHMQASAAVGGGADWAGYEYIAQTVRSALPALTKFGITTAEEADVDTLADRLRAETQAAGGVVKTPDLVGAWARVE
ncbi:MAG TPA: class I SAM-dependent methyltransferase [Thermomicrobiales bacterium]|nr:class I SAM-dependent methyltransferase [Thermomicrobiales bacterium]